MSTTQSLVRPNESGAVAFQLIDTSRKLTENVLHPSLTGRLPSPGRSEVKIKAMPGETVVLGFRPHTYWTAVVAMAGEPGRPRVVLRRRVDFAEGDTRLVYHQAAEMDLSAAPAFIEDIRRRVGEVLAPAVEALVASLAAQGHGVRQAVVPRGGGRIPDRLEDIVRSHSMQHAAEGEFYRDAVARACEGAGLETRRVIERELFALAADATGLGEAGVKAHLAVLGAELGPPWSEDQRYAALAAWIALAGAGADA